MLWSIYSYTFLENNNDDDSECGLELMMTQLFGLRMTLNNWLL